MFYRRVLKIPYNEPVSNDEVLKKIEKRNLYLIWERDNITRANEERMAWTFWFLQTRGTVEIFRANFDNQRIDWR